MPALRLPYRTLVPLALTGVALLAGIAVALTTFFLIDRHVEANAEAETRRLASTLARALVQPVLRNDIWQSYQLVRAATESTPQERQDGAVEIVVMDAREQVFVSPAPRQYPIGAHLSTLPASMIEATRKVLGSHPPGTARVAEAGDRSLVLAAPIVGDEDELLGVVLATHPAAISRAQRAAVVRQLTVLGLIAVALVALGGASLGLRLTAPLGRLQEVMQNTPRRATVREQLQSPELTSMGTRQDEVGELARTFTAMLRQIAANQELERHIQEAERLASIGQISASIAHEVNNPLGGMLGVIQNRRLRGGVDEATERTLGLLERGLHQIHETLQALLNEARREQRSLQVDDLHDLELLLRPEAEHLQCALRWQVAPPTGHDLPAVAVRQVVLNLTLNALAAAGKRGQVQAWSESSDTHWQVCVANTGPALDQVRLDALTHGTERSADGRLGLGLWITARILHTLGGRLNLRAPLPPELPTVLVASFPLQQLSRLSSVQDDTPTRLA
ncbi:MAG: HAMP domain-containing sensor histidine kinase [Hydrogenophaga sp.]|jgi:signal transduction histidine kinase|uniref:sensor histidine kinase n=1 Tax=Hydrogenophaga sp. TaxID=1904254 RepID=UPI002721B6D4|nr:HAMP domain-containing sensor histidine kinase [Hydrogenophaga sp.]MDO9568263.1 HAMP domain-containing sensor histidine kinase [Hydrogenophaga sp.]